MRITQNVYNNNVLSLIINSQIVRQQLLRIGTGGVKTRECRQDSKYMIIYKRVYKRGENL